jgi:hypothetical protein
MPSAEACSAKRSYHRPTSIQCALSAGWPMNTAIPAELRIWRAYLSFSLFGLNNQPKASSPSQVGTLGFPVVAL